MSWSAPRRRRRSTSSPSTMTFTRRSEEHTSELQSLRHPVCRLLLEKTRDFPFGIRDMCCILPLRAACAGAGAAPDSEASRQALPAFIDPHKLFFLLSPAPNTAPLPPPPGLAV